jgi:hypothetical protein
MNDEICYWTGASGTNYLYHVYERQPDIPSRLGNYIYALKNHEGHWAPVYIGQGDLSICAAADPGRMACIDAKGATHVHLRLNASEEERLSEVEDLLRRYLNAHHPHGCNRSSAG